MSLDAICLGALRAELEREITGMKVDKVQQPAKDRLVLGLRGNGKPRKLLISAGSGNARLHLTEEADENPATPPMLCMLLRKQLVGARIAALTQPETERVLDILFDAVDPMGFPCKRHLIFESMGKYANLILTDGEMCILACVHRLEGNFTESRMILPGLLYRLPPPQNKSNPAKVSPDFLREMLNGGGEKELSTVLMETFSGFSPLICRELAFRASGRTDIRVSEIIDGGLANTAVNVFLEFQRVLRSGDYTPYLLTDSTGAPKDFSFLRIGQYEGQLTPVKCVSFSEMLETFYGKRARAEEMRQRASTLTRTVKTALKRTEKKLAIQRSDLLGTQNRELLRKRGDLVTANLYRMEKGMSVLKTEDYYEEGSPEISIPLDPLKTPQQNAAHFYKEYNKAKNAVKYLTEQIQTAESDREYLLSVQEELEQAETEKDLTEIRQELTDTGFLRRPQQSSGKKEKRVEQKPMRFLSPSGFEIYVGKNNAQNDRLTLKTASRRDLWLHAQKIHGSHVVIASGGREVDEETLQMAASLAAYYSQGRNAGRVPVDYTAVKNVRKPSGAKPGMVLYTEYATISARPDGGAEEKQEIGSRLFS